MNSSQTKAEARSFNKPEKIRIFPKGKVELITIGGVLTIKPRIEYWFPLSGKAKKTMGRDDSGEKISYNPDGYVGCNVVTGLNINYEF